jgi:cytochrome c6|tara:strand:- start:100 stop:408 length:309 start_codon:yes stop_codon:yes gene_type:complete
MKKLIFLIFLFFTNLSYAEDLINIGENIFYNKEACVNCHILNAADGGNNQLSKEHVINIVTNGYGVMPAYKDTLTEKEIEAVAIFVSKEGKNWKNKLSSFVQ